MNLLTTETQRTQRLHREELLDPQHLEVIVGVDRLQISFLIKCECGPIAQKRILGSSRGGSVFRFRQQTHSASSFEAHSSSKRKQTGTIDNVSEPLLLEFLIHHVKRLILN